MSDPLVEQSSSDFAGFTYRDLTKFTGYKGGRRDRIAQVLANAIMRFASEHYRTLVDTAIRKGLRQMIREQSPNPPFTEPLDD